MRRLLLRRIPGYLDGAINIVDVRDVAKGHVLADERGEDGERYLLTGRNFTMDRLFADLARLSGIDPPAVKLPVRVALALAEGGRWVAGGAAPSPQEVRIFSLRWACSSAKAKRELGWRTSPHEDCLEETIAWYRRRDGARLSPPGARQPVALHVAPAAPSSAAPRSAGYRAYRYIRICIGMPTLYRCSTPTNWLCPCGKVARALARDGIGVDEVRVPQRRSRRPEVER